MAGAAAGGAQRGGGGGGTFNLYIGSSVRAGYLLSTSRATENFLVECENDWTLADTINRQDGKLAVNFDKEEVILRSHNTGEIRWRDAGPINGTCRP